MTRKKSAILDEIIRGLRPYNARELHEVVSTIISLDLATVYRALLLFKEKGIVREINDDSGMKFYEIACMHNPVHPHFKCSSCSRMECLRSLDDAEETFVSGFAEERDIESISIVLNGLCGECRKVAP